jgi:hypothetical protein
MRVPQRVSPMPNLFVIPAQAGNHGTAAPTLRLLPRTAPARWRRSGSGVLTHRGLNTERLLQRVKIPDMCRAEGARPLPGKQKFWDVRLRAHLSKLLVSLVLLFCAILMLIFGAAPAHAQSCTIDAQCAGGGRSVAMCVGDMLVVKSARCIGGSCQEREERRQNCGSGASQAISCQGSIAVRSGGGCDPIGQTCSARTDRDVCVKSCACVKNRLIVSTGQCVSGAGCARTSIQCQNGCTCSGEPRCL